jgi:hypothetical protein
MASEIVDLIVTPLREYGRKLYKETGRRVKLEVAIEAELFDRLCAECAFPAGARPVFFENAVQIVVTPKSVADRDPRDAALDAIATHVRDYILAPEPAKRSGQVALDRIERALLDLRDDDYLRPQLVESLSGPPLTGTCSSCGADLDALARTGVTGHECYGPGDATNHREPS